MARDPGSIWKPLPEAGAPDGHTKTQFIVHSTGTMASAAANWSYFNRGDVVVESTFIVGLSPADPTLQVMDSTDWADAVLSASGRAISVEVVGDGAGPFTDWQVGELIRLGLWAREAHGILPRIIPAPTDGGYGWHVMFGAPGPWTDVVGKVCPGARRTQQLKDTVFPAIFGTATTEDDMPFTEADLRRIIADEVSKVSETQGYAGAADWGTEQRPDGSWPIGARAKSIIAEEVGKVLHSEGVSGAGDPSHLAAVLTPVLSAKLAQAGDGSPAGTLTKEDVTAALREVLRAGVGS